MIRRSLRIAFGFSVAIAAAALLAGCSPATNVEGVDGHDYVIVTHPSTVELTAVASGHLVLVGSCLGIQDAAQTFLVAFHPGSHIVEDRGALLPDGTRIELGGQIQLAGGFVDPSPWDGYDRIPDDCITTDVFLVN